LKKPDVIVAFAFSRNGTANKKIASYSDYKSDEYGIPIFTQKDVSKHLEKTSVPVFLAEEKDGKYLSTLSIAKSLEKMAIERKWQTVLVIAAPCHIWRCCRDLKKLGFQVISDDYLRTYHFKFWYAPKDPQIWIHNPIIWWFRETILRLMPWKLYSKLAA